MKIVILTKKNDDELSSWNVWIGLGESKKYLLETDDQLEGNVGGNKYFIK